MSDYVPKTDLPLYGEPSRHNVRPTSLAAYRAADHKGNRAKCLGYVRYCGDLKPRVANSSTLSTSKSIKPPRKNEDPKFPDPEEYQSARILLGLIPSY